MNLDFLNQINFNLIIIQAPVILLSLTIHEYFHGWTANKLGDPTAKMRGRLTLNPIAHLDVLGTILMFVVGFGWAKPVPINPMNFKDPKKGTLLVAIAGPLSNLATAVVAGIILRPLVPKVLTGEIARGTLESIVVVMLILAVIYGIALAVFNLIPIPPLDGSRVMYAVLPDKYLNTYSRFEPYGVLFLFGLFFFGSGIFSYLLYPVSYLSVLFSGYNYGDLRAIMGLFLG
ncbi:MAG: site-2 protease family protein [Thermodesulfobacteriales bacterium]|jgi:Zn-dependent protease|nr:MAG: site-2 protease family protein [Thermodesulfobacteriales bacterium]